MAIFRKAALAAAIGGALLLGGCAADPYYDNYGYNGGYAYGYNQPYYSQPYYAQPYYGPAYVEPSVGFGIGFADYGGDRHWHHDRDGDRHEWHGDRGGHGGHDWHRDTPANAAPSAVPGGHEWHGGDHGGGGGDWRNDHGQNSGG